MITKGPYITEPADPVARAGLVARLAGRLHLDGEWDGALALLAGAHDGDPAGRPTGTHGGDPAGRPAGQDRGIAWLRARILVEAFWWRLDDPAPAERAVAGLEDPAQRGYLAAQLAYSRLLFGLAPRPGDEQVIDAGLAAAARNEALRGWVTFWQGVVADNIRNDPITARKRYAEARALCGEDLLLESYIVRHQGGHLVETDRPAGLMLLRRSLQLRAALGARPQTAAAQASLAGELQPGEERDMLLRAARATAAELGLTWLNSQLTAA